MMVARMKTVVNTFVSKQQLGFVPKRLIGEATHLLQIATSVPRRDKHGRANFSARLGESIRQGQLDLLPPSH
jgi:hypothetical protein